MDDVVISTFDLPSAIRVPLCHRQTCSKYARNSYRCSVISGSQNLKYAVHIRKRGLGTLHRLTKAIVNVYMAKICTPQHKTKNYRVHCRYFELWEEIVHGTVYHCPAFQISSTICVCASKYCHIMTWFSIILFVFSFIHSIQTCRHLSFIRSFIIMILMLIAVTAVAVAVVAVFVDVAHISLVWLFLIQFNPIYEYALLYMCRHHIHLPYDYDVV